MKKVTQLKARNECLAKVGLDPIYRYGCIIETETNKCLHCNWQKYWRYCMADMQISKGAKVIDKIKGDHND